MIDKKVLVVCHIYDYNIWKNDISVRLRQLRGCCDYDLFLSFTDNVDRMDEICEVIRDFSDTNVYYEIIRNLGEDVRGFMSCVEWLRVNGNRYDKVLKIHTKSEPDWRTALLDALIPKDGARLDDIIRSDYGFCSSKAYFKIYPTPDGAEFNAKYLDEQRDMCGCSYRTNNHFSGTMFWMDFGVMKRYFIDSRFTSEYFDQPYAIGYTKQHSFELLVGCVAYDCKKNIKCV